MKLAILRGQSPYPIPRAAMLAGALLIALGVTAAALPGIEQGPVVCPFRAVTGFPCPWCGLTRAAHWLMHGDPARAFAINPLDTLLLLVAVPAVAGMAVANRVGGFALRVTMSPGERRAAWGALAAMVAANWAFVLGAQGLGAPPP